MPSPLIGPRGLPSADEVARAIVAAARETGADPLAVARGDLDPQGGFARSEHGHKISRARAYAAYALLRVFGGPKQAIARMVGVKRDSATGYFQAIDRRGGMAQRWCVAVAFERVVAAIEAESLKDIVEAVSKNMAAPVVAKIATRPDWASPELNEIKPIEPKRTSSPPVAALRVEDFDEVSDDDGPVFDRGIMGGRKPANVDGLIRGSRPMTKAEMAADLAAAVARTAAMQRPEPDE